jgi:high affinity sulfate transporter 1
MTTTETSRLARVLPVSAWLPGYRAAWFGPDLLAGLTVWALVVPEAMAYAAIAGVPVQYGLYTVPLAVVGYAIFGTSRRLFVGPSSTVAVLSAATVAPVAASGSDHYVVLTAVLALVVGALYVALGLLRMGFIARFFAKPVLEGFILGLGIYMVVGQIYKVVGAPKPEGSTLQALWADITALPDWHGATVVVGAASLVLLFSLTSFLPRVPGALVVVVLGIAAASLFDLEGHGVEVVGSVPSGYAFVPWSGVTFDQVWAMIPGALGIIVVGYAESLAVAKTFAARDRTRIDPNGELIGYGAASIGAGLLQGFTTTGSLSKSAAADEAGSRTPVTFLVVGVLVVLTTLFITGVFEQLPEAVLGAVVIHAVWGMIDLDKLTRLRRAHVPDFWLALAALAGVITVGILVGIMIGVVLSLVLLIHRFDHPHVATLGRDPTGTRFEDVARHPDARPVPGVLIYRLEAPLVFANADVVADDLTSKVHPDEHRAVVFDLEAVYEVDTQGADTLLRLREELAGEGVAMALARTHGEVLDYLTRDGCIDALGSDAVFGTVQEAVDALAGEARP